MNSRRLLALFSLVRLSRVADELLQYEAVAIQVNTLGGELCDEEVTFARLPEARAEAEAECAPPTT